MPNSHTASPGAQSTHLNERYGAKNSPIPAAQRYTVQDLAERHNFKRRGKEWHGASPNGGPKTRDGFILNDDGTSYERDGQRYTSAQTAELFGIAPEQYAPVIDWRERHQTPAPPKKAAPAFFDWSRATLHSYHDENGALLFQVGRIGTGKEKQIRQRQPKPGGGWLYNLDGARRVVYGLPDVQHAQTVIFCEGEKAADALNSDLKAAGLFGATVATTTPQGAGNSHKCDLDAVHGKNMVIFPDANAQGEGYRDALFERLKDSCRVAVVELPDRGDGGDYADFRAAGHAFEEAQALIEAAPDWNGAAEPAKPRRFNFTPLAEIFTRPDPAFLVHRLLTIGGTSLLTAKHASFKSFFALDIGLCVATGRLWHGYEVERGAVVYIAAEGASGIKKRAAAWLAHHDEATPDNFHVLDVPFQVADASARRAFIEEISEIKPVLIVLDTLARCAIGLDENSAGDMGQFADALGALAKESGAHVMTVHHNNKGGEYRGSSAVPAAVDTHLSLERRGDAATLKVEKQKDDDELPEMSFEKIEVSIPNTGGKKHSLVFQFQESHSGSRFRLSQVEQRVLDELIEAFGPSGATAAQWCEVCKGAGISDRNFFRARKKLVELKAVSCPNEGERGAKFAPAFDYCQSLPVTANGSLAAIPPTHCQSLPLSLESGSDGSDGSAPDGEAF